MAICCLLHCPALDSLGLVDLVFDQMKNQTDIPTIIGTLLFPICEES